MAAIVYKTGVKALFLLLALALPTGPLFSQTAGRLVYAFVGIRALEEIQTEGRAIEKKLVTELVRLGVSENFSVVTPKNRDLLLKSLPIGSSPASKPAGSPPASLLPSARGMIVGDLSRKDGTFRLRVEILRTANLTPQNAAEAASGDFGVLQLEVVRLLHSLFDLPEPPLLHQPALPEIALPPPTVDAIRPADAALSDLVGTWKGDKTAESVKIRGDGSAVADLGGWNTMLLSVSIEDGRIIVRQDEPNSPKLYLDGFPYSTAVRVAEVARPLRWIFVLSRDKKMLTGIKESTFFVIDQGEILSADNSYTQETVWLKIP